ncbi:LptF/LptG family permease [Treponema sp.]
MTLDRYLLKYFIPVFIAGLTLFVLLLELIDLFANLWRYLAYDASFKSILQVALLYLPKCISYALPISLLFASAYVFGDLYARNELIIAFSSGIPLRTLARSFIGLSLVLSVASFYFEDTLVITSLKVKKELSRELLHQKRGANESDVVVKSDAGRVVYSVEFYNDAEQSLNGLTIVERDAQGRFLFMLNARRATWSGTSWSFENATAYSWVEGALKGFTYQNTHSYTEKPGTFRRNSVDVEELNTKDAAAFVQDLRLAGLPYQGALADYYKRFAFAATPLVVIMLSVGMGGRFRKNILLMSLLASLVSSVVYYVAQMIFMMLAKLGYIPPIIGAWAPAGVFILIGGLLLARART